MEDFRKLECGCYVGFDINHKPMWGKQCPLHGEASAMYETLKKAEQDINWMLNNEKFLNPEVFTYIDEALAKAEGGN